MNPIQSKNKYLLDTNIFDRLLEKNIDLPDCKGCYFITQIQRDEINNIVDPYKKNKKDKLLKKFEIIPSCFVLDISRLDEDEPCDDQTAKIFKEMLSDLHNLNEKSGEKKTPENEARDVQLLLTCLKKDLTLVTDDKNLRKIAKKYNVRSLSFDEFIQEVKNMQLAKDPIRNKI
ncbi:hypothetical protein DFR86_00100 [Acidianus sulfidivorans JP7]|uniref:PIN domain-containing protein n=1 Tax=Acidianus sulfidivorans JP7 TaxID=619593 RepID=A0A2U9IJF0_9CREN|nr:hypothetical protein [Acidianus sulfidivorans]AWR96106.1 hypothetical protein DFR86_00100 [Acidianus sulfidivorans JP7]